jgi:hypothetical protein
VGERKKKRKKKIQILFPKRIEGEIKKDRKKRQQKNPQGNPEVRQCGDTRKVLFDYLM